MDFLETDEGDEFDTTLMSFSTALKFKIYSVNEHIKRKRHMILKKEGDLQTMCLNVIADNFGLFLKSYCKWEKHVGSTKKEHMDLLRRLFSDRLYRMVNKKERSLPSHVITFFLTPYWKQVRLPGCGSHFPVFRSIGKTITFLNLQDSLASSDMLTAILCCVPNVVTLNLVSTECNDSVLALISKACKSLVTLNLGECKKVTDTGIAYLYNLDSKVIGFNSLKSLNINGTEVTENSIPLILKYLTSLEYLKYAVLELVLCDLYLNDMISDSDCYNLTSFEPSMISVDLPRYENLELKNVLELWTKVCPKVSRTYISEYIDEDHLDLLSKFEHLKALRLMDLCGSLLLTSTPFFKLRAAQLTEIHVKGVTLSIDDLMKSCVNLKKLTLDKVQFKDFNVCDESKLNDLAVLKFKLVNLIDDKVYKTLKVLLTCCKSLTKLAITYCSNFHVGVAECISDSPNITSLNLSFTDIKPNMLDIILASNKIKSICADGCPHISLKSKYTTHVNVNPHGNTCGWKIGSGYFDDIEEEKWIDSPWAEDY